MAWLTGWTYRKSITLSRASGAVSNYQMKILVGESSDATGEDVDCGGLCLSTFNDIRFTTSDGETLLSYWIESITGTTPNQLATIWVKFDSIGTGATTFYMYYGNSGASAVSSGTDTFLFFDDFLVNPPSSTDWFHWIDSGSETVSDSVFSVTGASGYNAWGCKQKFGTNHSFRGKVMINSESVGTGVDAYVFGIDDRSDDGTPVGTGADYAAFYIGEFTPTKYYRNARETGPPTYPNSSIARTDAITSWSVLEIARNSTTDTKFFINDVLKATNTGYVPLDTCGFMIYSNQSGHTISWDWVAVREYEETEPVWGSWGPETQESPPWLTGWNYRKPFYLSRPTGAVTDYQMSIFLGESAGNYENIFIQEWQTQPYVSANTTVNSTGGILNVTSTTSDPNFLMYSLGNFDPNTYKTIAVRYRVLSGTAGQMTIYFCNARRSSANEDQQVTTALNSDGEWHILYIDMSVHQYWTNSNITGWRYDWCDQDAVTMEFDYISLTRTSDVDCGGLCESDFKDIRFTTSDGTTLLNYWIGKILGTTPNQLATVWVKFDSITESSTEFYMYYGNSGASAVSSGTDTFILFDDFNDGSFNTDMWSKQESNNLTVTEPSGTDLLVGGTINTNGGWNDCYARSVSTFTSNYAVGASLLLTGSGTGRGGFIRLQKDTSNNTFTGARLWTAPTINYLMEYKSTDDATYYVLDATNLDSAYHIYEIEYERSTGKLKFRMDGSQRGTDTLAGIANVTTYIELGCIVRVSGDNGVAKFDYTYIRKSEYVTPVFDLWGEQETPPAADNLAFPNATRIYFNDVVINKAYLGDEVVWRGVKYE